jgi:hypothetical protein
LPADDQAARGRCCPEIPLPARRTTHGRGTGRGGKITRDLVLATELEIIDRDGAEALSMRRLVAGRLDLDDQQLTWQCEQAIRNYDPCISCATHFLDLTVDHT